MNAVSLVPAAQSALDEHLDAVERALLDSGVSRTERHAICDEIQSQVRDMLEARGKLTPTRMDLCAILAEMDPPESYRNGGRSSAPIGPTTPKRLHPAAVSSVVLPIVAIVVMFLPFGPKGESAGIAFLSCATLVSAGLAITAIIGIRQNPEHYSGIGWAAVGICVMPTAFLVTIAVFNWAPALEWYFVGAAEARERQIEQQRIMLQLALAITAQTGRGRSAQKSAPAPAPNPLFEPLTPQERWLVDHRGWVRALSRAVVTIFVVSVSLLAPWLIYQTCRPSATAHA